MLEELELAFELSFRLKRPTPVEEHRRLIGILIDGPLAPEEVSIERDGTGLITYAATTLEERDRIVTWLATLPDIAEVVRTSTAASRLPNEEL